MKFYVGRHNHRHGQSLYLFQSDGPLNEDDFEKLLVEEFEPDREDEYLELDEMKPTIVTAAELAAGADQSEQPVSPEKRLEDASAAELACRTLVEAYEKNPSDVDWSDVQDALSHALTALGLPQDHLEKFSASDDETSDMTP